MRKLSLNGGLVLVLVVAALWACDESADGGGPDTVSDAMDSVEPEQDQVTADDLEDPDSGKEIPTEDPYTEPSGAEASFDVAGSGFFDKPFPTDLRRTASGRLNLTGFPNPYKLSLITQYVDKAQEAVDGFSPSSTVYFRFDAPLADNKFPKLAETVTASSEVQLVNVTSGSPSYGRRIPVEMFYWDREAPTPGYYLEPYLLMARPLGGFPMAAGETYACMVLRDLRDASGKQLTPTPAVQDALVRAQGPLADSLAPLRTLLTTTDGPSVWDVAVATVFTVSNPTKDLLKVADFLRQKGQIDVAQQAKSIGPKYGLSLYSGYYLAPNFMHGDPPYDKGGDFKFDADGAPVVHHMEKIPFTIGLPQNQTPPAGGWPVVQMSHGTGGSRNSFTYDGSGYELAQKGFATISIDQPLHGDRYTGPSINVEIYSFNFTNPSSGRTLFQQAALDNVALTKALGDMAFKDEDGRTHRFNTSKVGYFGHSQGGITGALFVAVEDGIDAAVLSGAGGGLAYTILLRKEIDSGQSVDIKQMMAMLLKLKFDDELDLFHPMMTLIQTLVDATDPLNYTPHYFKPRFRQKPLPVFMTSGIDDPYTPAITAENMALAGGIPLKHPVLHTHPGFELAGLQPAALPVSNNLSWEGESVTALMAQFDGYGHFPIFDDESAIAMYTNFMYSALIEGAPKVHQ